MVFTPAEQVIPAKARVGPDDDRDLRPALPNPADDPFQFLHRSRGPIDIGTPQPGAQQMLPREDVQREITVVAVVTVKEPAFLLAMDRVVGRIQIQHDLLGRRFVGLHEGIHHPAVDPVRVHRDLLVPLLLIDLGAGQLQPVQRTPARQRLPPI